MYAKALKVKYMKELGELTSEMNEFFTEPVDPALNQRLVYKDLKLVSFHHPTKEDCYVGAILLYDLERFSRGAKVR